MRTVFFGTPEWAVPSLEALAASPHRPSLVVTQPAKRRERAGTPEPSPVAHASARLAIDCIAPASIRAAEALARLEAERADLFVVGAFGAIFPKAVLETPRLGCVNLHFSLLPRYRGAAPVQRAIAEGETETGVTTMKLVPELDAGPIYIQERTSIGTEERASSLGSRLARVGPPLIVATLDGIESGAMTPREQDPREATYARSLTADDGRIDWNARAETIARRVRGFDPWPGQATQCRTGRLRIVEARAAAGDVGPGPAPTPGLVLGASGDACRVACGENTILEAFAVRPEGRQTMSGAAALRGRHMSAGERLGGPDVTHR